MKVIIPPLIEPVSLAEVKTQIGIQPTDTEHDALISRRIKEAREWAEAYTGRAFITQTREIRWDGFTYEHELPSALTVVSVKYIDESGIEQTLDSGSYFLDTYSFIPALIGGWGLLWPSSRLEKNAIRIQYTAGYGPLSTDVPVLKKEAIILLVGHWMNFQPQSESGTSISRVPYAVRDMLDTYKINFL